MTKSKRANKCGDRYRSLDRISMLPDELLVSITSHLTFKELIAASIISRQWRYLWTFSRTLDFDGTTSLSRLVYSQLELDNLRSNYVGWVNRVLALRKEPALDEFRVFFNLTETNEKSIDEWLRYALARKIWRLELNLTNAGSARHPRICDECYTFPYELLRDNSSHSVGFKYLKKLSLNYVNVNDDALKFILRNCPLLEDLSIFLSAVLTSARIIGPLPSLKRLEISLCFSLKVFEVRDVNLVCLTYVGSRIYQFVLENVPLLVNVSIGGMITRYLKDVLQLLSRCLPTLQMLRIDILDLNAIERLNDTSRYALATIKMLNLKQLVVKVHVPLNDSLIPLINLLCVAPNLQRFVLKVSRWQSSYRERAFEKLWNSSFACLKEITFEGYRGLISDLELVTHFLKNATSLQKIVIDPRKPCSSEISHPMLFYEKGRNGETGKEIEAIRTLAKKQLTVELRMYAYKVRPRKIILDIL